MSEKKKKEEWLELVGHRIREMRYSMGKEFRSREFFVQNRSESLFNYEDWISSRYLASIELGNNQLSIEKLIRLAFALEVEPIELFAEIVEIYQRVHNSGE
ncbi:MAG: XRE family transcriptional regulator [Ruminiclostridium sp.]|nr:XRE family transcriptional regulator [Ruminiclostridium sp.]